MNESSSDEDIFLPIPCAKKLGDDDCSKEEKSGQGLPDTRRYNALQGLSLTPQPTSRSAQGDESHLTRSAFAKQPTTSPHRSQESAVSLPMMQPRLVSSGCTRANTMSQSDRTPVTSDVSGRPTPREQHETRLLFKDRMRFWGSSARLKANHLQLSVTPPVTARSPQPPDSPGLRSVSNHRPASCNLGKEGVVSALRVNDEGGGRDSESSLPLPPPSAAKPEEMPQPAVNSQKPKLSFKARQLCRRTASLGNRMDNVTESEQSISKSGTFTFHEQLSGPSSCSSRSWQGTDPPPHTLHKSSPENETGVLSITIPPLIAEAGAQAGSTPPTGDRIVTPTLPLDCRVFSYEKPKESSNDAAGTNYQNISCGGSAATSVASRSDEWRQNKSLPAAKLAAQHLTPNLPQHPPPREFCSVLPASEGRRQGSCSTANDSSARGTAREASEASEATMCTFAPLLSSSGTTVVAMDTATPWRNIVFESTLSQTATRASQRHSDISSLYLSMIKPLRRGRKVPFLSPQQAPSGDVTVDEPFGFSTSAGSFMDGGSGSVASSVNADMGVIETDVYVFMPRYEPVNGAQSPIEVILSSMRDLCAGCDFSDESSPLSKRSSPRRNGSEHAATITATSTALLPATPVGSRMPEERYVREGLGIPAASVGVERTLSTTSGGMDNVSAAIVSNDGGCFVFGSVAPSYSAFPNNDGEDESDCKVAARLIFEADKGVLLLTPEDKVERYMNISKAAAGLSKGFICSGARPAAVQQRVGGGEGDDAASEDSTRTHRPDEVGTLQGKNEGSTRSKGENVFYEDCGSISRCSCSQEFIAKDTRGVDYRRYHSHKLYHHCTYCGRRPACFLCLHCLAGVCPSHVTQHYNESLARVNSSKSVTAAVGGTREAVADEIPGDCALFINILDFMNSFDRIFWCERCRSFTWRYTEVYDPLVDQLAATLGTYLQEPARDITCVGYEVKLRSHVASSAQHPLLSTSFSPITRERTAADPGGLLNTLTVFLPPGAEDNLPAFDRAVIKSSATGTSREGWCPSAASGSFPPILPSTSASAGSSDQLQVGMISSRLVSLGAEVQGWRATQEDAEAVFVVSIPTIMAADGKSLCGGSGCADGTQNTVTMAFFCVFDGHGGDAVAKLAASRIEFHVRRAINSGRNDEMLANGVLGRIDFQSSTPRQSASEASPHHAFGSGNLFHLNSAEAGGSGVADEAVTRRESFMTVEMLKRHVEGSSDMTDMVKDNSSNSDLSRMCQGLSSSPLVSRQKMGHLRCYFARIMEEALFSLDDELRNSVEGRRGDYNSVGSTACIVGITTNFILCANVGDSGAAFYTSQ
ncbi:unnamed protein product, partial [Trypanosoma congolense IL3000]